ncbi:ScyD/ScyE family protein [Actinophytocola sp.]|uniref:ScyD/ScyE family protein n=1 Tax=Actinophytocola sp. TaxID=1872138 RepID=UPI003D6C0FEB
MPMRATRSRLAAALVAAGTVCSILVTPGIASAHSGMTTVARGLDSPRGLAFGPDGSLYVAEAGSGGTAPCFDGPEGGRVCFGTSGAISKISHGRAWRVVRGLPSIGDEGTGTNAIGPSDVAFRGHNLYFTVGLGADPALRAGLPPVGQRASGWLLRDKRHGVRQVADVAGFEATANPDGGLPDSNPQSVLTTHRGQLVADAGGNSLVRVSQSGRMSTVATFPDQLVDAPPFLGLPPGTKIPMQAVPTSVVRGPDGGYYVGTLTGFPFQVGSARVYRVVPGRAPTVYAGGFTNVIDIAFGPDRRLYVLEIAHHGLLSGDPTGALLEAGRHGSHRIVASTGLNTPGGLAIRGRSAYVSNCGTCPDNGSVVRIPLR